MRLSDVAEGAEEGLPVVEGHLDDLLPQDDVQLADGALLDDAEQPGQA